MTPREPRSGGRYTGKHSIEALRQSWAATSENDPRLNAVGIVLARAAKHGPRRFRQVCRELLPEMMPNGTRR